MRPAHRVRSEALASTVCKVTRGACLQGGRRSSGTPRQLQPAEQNQPSYARAPPLRATPVSPRRPRPGAQQREVQGEASRVPGETGARRARSPAPQASRTAPLGASMRPRTARAPPPSSTSPAGPGPWAAGTCAGGVRRSESLRGVLGSRHLSCLEASPFRPPPGLERTSPAQAWPLWTPDSGFSASFRKGRFFSTPRRRKVCEHHPDCFLSQR